MSRIATQAGQVAGVTSIALVVQQLVTAGVYGVLAYPFGTNLRVSWFDYVEEYLLWRLRLPGHSMTRVEIVANAVGLFVVLAGAVLLTVKYSEKNSLAIGGKDPSDK